MILRGSFVALSAQQSKLRTQNESFDTPRVMQCTTSEEVLLELHIQKCRESPGRSTLVDNFYQNRSYYCSVLP